MLILGQKPGLERSHRSQILRQWKIVSPTSHAERIGGYLRQNHYWHTTLIEVVQTISERYCSQSIHVRWHCQGVTLGCTLLREEYNAIDKLLHYCFAIGVDETSKQGWSDMS